MARPLKSGATRVLGRHDGRAGRMFDAHYRALEDALGPFTDRLARDDASAVAGDWVEWRMATEDLVAARRSRELGRGRRPSPTAIVRFQKRAGLARETYVSGRAALEAKLVRRNGHRPARDTLAARLAAMPPLTDGED